MQFHGGWAAWAIRFYNAGTAVTGCPAIWLCGQPVRQGIKPPRVNGGCSLAVGRGAGKIHQNLLVLRFVS